MKRATPRRTLLTTSPFSNSLSRTSSRRTTAEADTAAFISASVAEKGYIAEAEKNLAAVLMCGFACKDSCSQQASDKEASVSAFAEKLKAVVVAIQILGFQAREAERQTYTQYWCPDKQGAQRDRGGDECEASRPKGTLFRTCSARFAHLLYLGVRCGFGRGSLRQNAGSDYGLEKQVAVVGFVGGRHKSC